MRKEGLQDRFGGHNTFGERQKEVVIKPVQRSRKYQEIKGI